MALVVKDRVKETTATTGTGTLTLAGAVAGFQTFTSVLSNGDTTYYGIFESSTGEFEVGLGTFTSSGTTLARTTILESSNSGSAINLTAGAADVFITQPAEKAVYLDGSGYIATADGRNLTNVDAATVDSLDSTQFLRSDANDTATGELTFNAKLDVANDTFIGWGGGTSRPSVTGNKSNNRMQFYTDGAERFHIDNDGVDVTGNIVVSGTVDGRDVATDGTKLDGIESGATTDQTKADIDALNINADTVDSLHASRLGPTYELPNTAASASWVKLGNFAAAQTGISCLINVVTNSGYNASDAQNSQTLIRFKTSNNSSNQSGFYGDVQAYKTGPNGSPSDVRVVQVSTTSFDIWVYLGTYSGYGGFYTVNQTDGTWTHSGSTGTPSGTSIDATINTMWHSGNDGAGSGLDADTLDGVEGASYLRSDTNDTFTGTLTVTATLDANIVNGNSYVYAPNMYLNDTLYHTNDTNTYLNFQTDEIRLTAGGSQEVTINTTGVRLGDTGNGYFQPVSGTYGSIQIDGGAHNGWEGYSIGGYAVFMSDSANSVGLYNDSHNQWWFRGYFNGQAYMYNAGVYKLNTHSSGVNIEGDLNAVDNIYVATNIYHEGDTNTYVGFRTDAIDLYTGGTNSTFSSSGLFITDGSLAEDYDALSGTTPTCNVDNGGMFSLTMTGNTTFTFSGAASGYIQGFVLQLTGNGSTVTWPTSVDWAGGTAPDAPASGETDILVFITRDGGTNWYGALAIDAAA